MKTLAEVRLQIVCPRVTNSRNTESLSAANVYAEALEADFPKTLLTCDFKLWKCSICLLFVGCTAVPSKKVLERKVNALAAASFKTWRRRSIIFITSMLCCFWGAHCYLGFSKLFTFLRQDTTTKPRNLPVPSWEVSIFDSRSSMNFKTAQSVTYRVAQFFAILLLQRYILHYDQHFLSNSNSFKDNSLKTLSIQLCNLWFKTSIFCATSCQSHVAHDLQAYLRQIEQSIKDWMVANFLRDDHYNFEFVWYQCCLSHKLFFSEVHDKPLASIPETMVSAVSDGFVFSWMCYVLYWIRELVTLISRSCRSILKLRHPNE